MKQLILLITLMMPGLQRTDSLDVVFWNVENFFDWHTGNGPEGWSAGRFYRKCEGVAKTILKIADSRGRLADAVGLAEVENSFVLRRLVDATALCKLDYGIVHFDSPDHRGIDCALLYRKSSLRLLKAAPKHLYDSTGAVMATRDILCAEFAGAGGDTLAVLVNHHPSQIGGKTEGRNIAAARLRHVTDSLQRAGVPRTLAVGDFNEDRWGNGGPGTIKYNGAWEKIDGHFALGFTSVEETVFDDPSLSEPDKAFGGTKPRRTFIGPRYNGGVSDHYPIVVTVYF